MLSQEQKNYECTLTSPKESLLIQLLPFLISLSKVSSSVYRSIPATVSPYPAENPTLLPQTQQVTNASWHRELSNPLQENPQGSTLDGNPWENQESQRPDNTQVGKSTGGMCCHNKYV